MNKYFDNNEIDYNVICVKQGTNMKKKGIIIITI